MVSLRQKELAVWQEKNFPKARLMEMSKEDLVEMIVKLQVALGMAEEVGEICHHVLKGTQKIRGGIDGINRAEVADGFGDVMIYGTQLCSRTGIDAEKAINDTIDVVLARDWIGNPEGK